MCSLCVNILLHNSGCVTSLASILTHPEPLKEGSLKSFSLLSGWNLYDHFVHDLLSRRWMSCVHCVEVFLLKPWSKGWSSFLESPRKMNTEEGGLHKSVIQTVCWVFKTMYLLERLLDRMVEWWITKVSDINRLFSSLKSNCKVFYTSIYINYFSDKQFEWDFKISVHLCSCTYNF